MAVSVACQLEKLSLLLIQRHTNPARGRYPLQVTYRNFLKTYESNERKIEKRGINDEDQPKIFAIH